MAIELRNVSYHYEDAGSLHSGRMVLDDINVTVNQNEFTAVIGPTGSGKSTLVQHLNLLLHASSGDILYNGESIYAEGYDKKALRSKIGVVFQYPEYQLFESDVLTDVCFGPKNLGLTEEEVLSRAKEALKHVGLSEDDYTKSPFELSGGQKRRVAIAGVLAMKPEYLILDEPAAGLDPKGRRELLGMIKEIKDRAGIGVVLVSHSMDDVANYADRILVLHKSKIVYDGAPSEVFSHGKELYEMGLGVPQAAYVADMLKKNGITLPDGLIRTDEVAEEIAKALNKK